MSSEHRNGTVNLILGLVIVVFALSALVLGAPWWVITIAAVIGVILTLGGWAQRRELRS